tara:strand:- start:294 stop:905 length:612 start_codon:yes stop_codon:yes gene_type:complete
MDSIRFTKHSVILDYREVYHSVPTTHTFKPRANKQTTMAVIADVGYDVSRKGLHSNNANLSSNSKCEGRVAFGRLKALGHSSNVALSVVGRIKDLILGDKTGLHTTLFSEHASPYENLGWYIDGCANNNVCMPVVSFHRVIVNGKQHSLEWYRDKYLPKILKKRMLKEYGYYNDIELALMPPRLLLGSVDDVYEHISKYFKAS